MKQTCRELGRKYLETIRYDLNNLFTLDWSEDDFGELNFYDLYGVLYRMKSGQSDPAGTIKLTVNAVWPEKKLEKEL